MLILHDRTITISLRRISFNSGTDVPTILLCASMVYPDQRNSGSVGVGITEKGSWGIAVPKILERARETSPAGRCHHGVAACSDLGPSGVVWHFLCVPSVCHLLYSSVIRARSSEQVNSARGVYPYRVYLYSAFQQVVNPYAFSAPVVLSPVYSFVPGVS